MNVRTNINIRRRVERSVRNHPKLRKRTEQLVENKDGEVVFRNKHVPQVIERVAAWPGITTGDGQFWWSTLIRTAVRVETIYEHN